MNDFARMVHERRLAARFQLIERDITTLPELVCRCCDSRDLMLHWGQLDQTWSVTCAGCEAHGSDRQLHLAVARVCR